MTHYIIANHYPAILKDEPVARSSRSPYIASFFERISDQASKNLGGADVVLITTEHFLCMPDIAFGEKPPSRAPAIWGAPAEIALLEIDKIKEISKKYQNISYIINGLVGIDGFEEVKNYVQDQLSVFDHSCEFPFMDGFKSFSKSAIEKSIQANNDLYSNVSFFIKNGETNFRLKYDFSGMYASRAVDILDMDGLADQKKEKGDLYFSGYSSKMPLKYLNGPPSSFVSIDGKHFNHAICADAIIVWSNASLAASRSQLAPMIIQGDSMSPKVFLTERLPDFFLQADEDWVTESFVCTATDETLQYPAEILFSFKEKEKLLKPEDIKNEKINYFVSLLLDSQIIVFADTAVDKSRPSMGAVYKVYFDGAKGLVFSRQPALETYGFKTLNTFVNADVRPYVSIAYSVYGV